MSLDGIHTIPVPQGWSPEQAWQVIARGGDLPDELPRGWANVRIEGGKLVELIGADDPERVEPRHWIVCDRCGYLRVTPDDPVEGQPCPNCTSTAAWVFPTMAAAHAYQGQVHGRVAGESARSISLEQSDSEANQ